MKPLLSEKNKLWPTSQWCGNGHDAMLSVFWSTTAMACTYMPPVSYGLRMFVLLSLDQQFKNLKVFKSIKSLLTIRHIEVYSYTMSRPTKLKTERRRRKKKYIKKRRRKRKPVINSN